MNSSRMIRNLEFQVGNSVAFTECPSALTAEVALNLTRDVNWEDIEERNLRSLLARLSRTEVPVIDDWAISPLAAAERRDFWEICQDLGNTTRT